MPDNNPTIAMRRGAELDLQAVDLLLREQIRGLQGAPSIRQFASGASNLTYLISYQNRELVLRKPPAGKKAKGAHSMAREVEVISKLKNHYPAVPTIVYFTDDESALGSEFYVMEKIEGTLVKASLPDAWQFSDADKRAFCRSVFDKLIELHRIDIGAAGLQDFGRPEGYVERQIRGWNHRYQQALTDDVPAFEDVRLWLEQSMPGQESAHSIIHGDFRIDNVMLDASDPLTVVAVLDWELSALGDPLMDLGNSLAYWIQADDPPELQALSVQPSNVPGMLSRAEILDYYHAQSGHDVSDFDFYLIYGYFRLAVILQQLYYRFVNRHTQDRRFASYGHAATSLGNHCRRLIALL